MSARVPLYGRQNGSPSPVVAAIIERNAAEDAFRREQTEENRKAWLAAVDKVDGLIDTGEIC